MWRYDLVARGTPKRLTFFNKPVEDEVDIRPAERLSVAGADGKPVEVFLVKPHGFDPSKKYPLILNVHGGPQQQWMDSFRGDWQVYPGSGYIVAFPNPHGSNGYGQDYCDSHFGRLGRQGIRGCDEGDRLPVQASLSWTRTAWERWAGPTAAT